MPPTNPSKPVLKGTHDQVRALKELDPDNTDDNAFKLVTHIIDFLPILLVLKLSCKIRLSRGMRRDRGLLGLEMDEATTAGALGRVRTPHTPSLSVVPRPPSSTRA